MPPAVEAEPPPMNMSMSVTSRLEPSSCDMSIVEKPPDLAIDRDEEALQDALAGVDVRQGRRVVELEHEEGERRRRRAAGRR